MALFIKFNSVILRKSAVDEILSGKLPSSLDSLNGRLIEDSNLLGWPAFMDSQTPSRIARILKEAGLAPGREATSAFCIVSPGFSNSQPAWLEVAILERTWACWLRGTDPGEVVHMGNRRRPKESPERGEE